MLIFFEDKGEIVEDTGVAAIDRRVFDVENATVV